MSFQKKFLRVQIRGEKPRVFMREAGYRFVRELKKGTSVSWCPVSQDDLDQERIDSLLGLHESVKVAP